MPAPAVGQIVFAPEAQNGVYIYRLQGIQPGYRGRGWDGRLSFLTSNDVVRLYELSSLTGLTIGGLPAMSGTNPNRDHYDSDAPIRSATPSRWATPRLRRRPPAAAGFNLMTWLHQQLMRLPVHDWIGTTMQEAESNAERERRFHERLSRQMEQVAAYTQRDARFTNQFWVETTETGRIPTQSSEPSLDPVRSVIPPPARGRAVRTTARQAPVQARSVVINLDSEDEETEQS